MSSGDLPPLAAVRVFEAAARHLSFTRAAEELGMTQAAVSYQIKLLEERVGAPLFLRKPRNVELTTVGQQFAPVVSDAFSRLRTSYAEARGETRMLLSVTTVTTFASNWLAPRLGLFHLEHPGIAVRLDTETRNRDFAREDVDVGIRGGNGRWDGMDAHLLMPIEYTPMISPELLRKVGPLDDPARLLDLPIVDPSDPWWPRWMQAVGVDPAPLKEMPITHTGSQVFEANVALSGHGVAILTPAFFRDELHAGRLVQPFEHIGNDGDSFWLVYATQRKNVPKIRHFRSWILSQFKT